MRTREQLFLLVVRTTNVITTFLYPSPSTTLKNLALTDSKTPLGPRPSQYASAFRETYANVKVVVLFVTNFCPAFEI